MTRLILILALLPAPALAQDGRQSPTPEFFTGLYRMLGADQSGPVDQTVRLDQAGEYRLSVTFCGQTGAETLALPGPEDDHYIEGSIGGRVLVCNHFMSYENYPLLACHGDGDTRLTLWPADQFDTALDCGG